MKYSQISPAPKILVRHETAAAMLEDRTALDALVAAGWLKPVRQGAKVRLYLVKDIHDAVDRARRDGWPDLVAKEAV